ncbi:MAG TPA: hypothetical protein VF707_12665, partial [Ardenticatenaceae bacterium]
MQKMITFDDIGIVHVINWRQEAGEEEIEGQECREWEKGACPDDGDGGMKRHVNSIGSSEKMFGQYRGKG